MQAFGGVSRYVTELCRALRSLDVEAEVLAYLHANSYARAAGRGVDVGALGPRKARQAFTLAIDTALERVSRARRRCDVYHYSYYPRMSAGRTKGITAVTVYDMIHERYPAEFDRGDHTAESKRRLCNSADAIFAISEATKADVVDLLGVPAERITVTLLGPSSLPAVPRREGNRPTVLYVGDRRRGYKNFGAALRGFAAVGPSTDAQLVCAGGGALTASEIVQIRSLGLGGRVRAVEVTDQGLAVLYSRAYALFVPSRCEGFSLPLLEAMQAGCPIVCSRAGAVAEVTAGAALSFDAESIDDIAAALTAVISDDRLREDLAARGRARAPMFSWHRCALATLDGYRRAGAQY